MVTRSDTRFRLVRRGSCVPVGASPAADPLGGVLEAWGFALAASCLGAAACGFGCGAAFGFACGAAWRGCGAAAAGWGAGRGLPAWPCLAGTAFCFFDPPVAA